ncbi:MAG: hypothetical protein MZW92_16465 [Comamonadaceae bacterium]|nr:hypothetical protein [Comamonadaceae bacterium]
MTIVGFGSFSPAKRKAPQRAQSENRGGNQRTGERCSALQARGRPEADGRNRAAERV